MTRPAFEGKLCVVTGAGSGIGRALALDLARRGAALALSDINEETLKETKTLIGAASNRIRCDRLDVADAGAVERYAETVRESLGEADYLFNVAGLSRIGAFEETPLSSFEKVMNVNFWSVVRMTKAFLPQLIRAKGVVVNVSSIFGIIGYAGQTPYCASKFAVRGFSETLAQELQDHGVAVISVHPGGIATNIVRNAEVDALPKSGRGRDEINADFDKVAKTSPAKAAEVILNGAAKRKRRVLIGPDAALIALLQRLFPVNYAKVLRAAINPNVAR